MSSECIGDGRLKGDRHKRIKSSTEFGAHKLQSQMQDRKDQAPVLPSSGIIILFHMSAGYIICTKSARRYPVRLKAVPSTVVSTCYESQPSNTTICRLIGSTCPNMTADHCNLFDRSTSSASVACYRHLDLNSCRNDTCYLLCDTSQGGTASVVVNRIVTVE